MLQFLRSNFIQSSYALASLHPKASAGWIKHNITNYQRCFSGFVIKPIETSLPLHRKFNGILLGHNYIVRCRASSQSPNSSQSGRSPEPGPGENPEKNNDQFRKVLIAAGVLLIQLAVFAHLGNKVKESELKERSTEITWTQFVNDYLKKGEVEAVFLVKGSNYAYIKLHPGAVIKGRPVANDILGLKVDDSQNVEYKIREIEKELGISAGESLKIIWKDFSLASTIFRVALFSLIIYLLYLGTRSIRRSLQTINPFETITKASYTRGDMASASTPSIKFSDIAGMYQAKIEVKEYVEYLRNPSRFQNLGARIPKGALLLGPPGCGKTLLAKAVAAESGVPFLVMAGSDFVEMIGGLGAARMRQLFKDARNLRPCIIYIDEIDALGRSRSESDGLDFGAGESEHTLNQLLVEMDGMTDNSGIIMLASTNRADVLDRALLRPGRFDRQITIELPTLSERKDLFMIYLQKINLEKPVTSFVDYLAQATPGMSGADIANVCNEAALHAARQGRPSVSEADLAYALDRIIAGQAKMTNTLSPAERKTIAYHECGHVLVSWMLRHTDALLKVSIIPRTSATLGFAQYMPSDKKLYSKQELFEMMCVALGGRAAETVVFNRVTSGAENDLDKVRELAYSQIKNYGMGDSVGLLAFRPDPSQDFQVKPYSKYLQSLMDLEAQQLIASAYKTAEDIISKNRDKLDKLTSLLLEKEELTYDNVKSLIGPPPHGEKKSKDFQEIVDTTVVPS